MSSTNLFTIIAGLSSGKLSRQGATDALETLRIRGGFDLDSNGNESRKFVGYDYSAQKWVEFIY